MKKRLLACLLTVAMLVSFFPYPAFAADAGDVIYRDYNESSQTWNENATRGAGTYTLVSNNDITWGDDGHDGWYVLNADTQFGDRISVKREVHLILMDGYTLTANLGITVEEGNSLTIYAQSNGAGALVAESKSDDSAGIGSNYGAGIGGGAGGAGGNITINGGMVAAANNGGDPNHGMGGGAGIGGGADANGVANSAAGKISITSGTVVATSSGYGVGIGGGGAHGDDDIISITGGGVTAQGGNVGISCNNMIEISDGSVTAQGGSVGIRGDITVEIRGGAVTADGADGGILSSNAITITGGTVAADGTDPSSGIGISSEITAISGGTVTATGKGAGISSGMVFTTGTVGNAFIMTSSILDQGDGDRSGVIFVENEDGGQGKVYNSPITLTTDATIPAGKTLVIDEKQTLIIPNGVTLTNNGTIINNGTITGEGTLSGN
ncbi:MAG: carbohydrate-binding domain-containing protein, partial [Lachnospiraceae bacterium]|nr:carbohydrate-binding domain-containing protein [Lachnospiraceae bacterium]